MSKHDGSKKTSARGRGLWIGLAAALWLGAAGCDKPTASECRKAIDNIRVVLGTSQQSEFGDATQGWIRSCRGSAKRKAVQCAIEAGSVEALKSCGLISAKEIDELLQLDRDLQRLDKRNTDPGAGSAAPGAGSAAPAAGSAAPAAGSAAAPAAGSAAPAAGSAAPAAGSAAPAAGSAAPAAGSAAPAAGSAAAPAAGAAAPAAGAAAPAAGSAAPAAGSAAPAAGSAAPAPAHP